MVSKVITKTTKTTTTKTTTNKPQKKNDAENKTASISQNLHDTIKLQKKLNAKWERGMKKALVEHPEQFETPSMKKAIADL